MSDDGLGYHGPRSRDRRGRFVRASVGAPTAFDADLSVDEALRQLEAGGAIYLAREGTELARLKQEVVGDYHYGIPAQRSDWTKKWAEVSEFMLPKRKPWWRRLLRRLNDWLGGS